MPGNCREDAGAPAVTVDVITEPTAVDAGIALIDQHAVQLQPLPLRARRVIVRLGAATVLLASTNRRLKTSTRVREGLIAYVTFGPGAVGQVNGTPVRPGLLLGAEAGAEARFVVEPAWESVTFFLSPEDVRGHLVARRRAQDFHLPRGIEPLRADSDAVRRLFEWGRTLASIAARNRSLFERGRLERSAAEVELIEMLLPVLGSAEPLEPTRRDRTGRSHSEVVKIAEAHVMARVGEPISVSDLCRAAGVSERTLEYAFRDALGLSPVAYLIRLRLHQVRRRLLARRRAPTTVSAEALRWGFWHFGDFSRAYKSCFGESPSETLRRAESRSA
jgi:AraC-like DNA-binding protein